MSNQWEVQFRVKQSKVDGKVQPTKASIKSLLEEKLIAPELLPFVKDSLKVINKTSGGARAKGSGSDFERKIAHALGQWWWDQDFRRTPNSGAWDKQANDGTVQAAGDLFTPPEAEFPYCVECKHRKEAVNFFTKKNDSSDCILDWWDQSVADAEMCGKHPILVMGCKRTEYIAIRLADTDHLICKNYPQSITIEVDTTQLFDVMLFKDFLENFRRPNGDEVSTRKQEAGGEKA